ncbi:hypothetical protein GEV33_006424 [Tenebrio molitor]|uniref:Uncharacterized protein n=1 Tax=Tenebrio molitor TaxID=7067 RepID=A0A8J6LDJ8_TENMO|nr:hypothetical protein GEV33_006424 [Tenebrio molitor]
MHCYPSAVACASVVSALCGLGWVTKYHQSQEGLLEKLAKMVDVPETELMQELVTQIDRMVKDNFEGVVEDRKNVCDDEVTRSEQCTPPPGKMRDYKTATTPTDHDGGVVFAQVVFEESVQRRDDDDMALGEGNKLRLNEKN